MTAMIQNPCQTLEHTAQAGTLTNAASMIQSIEQEFQTVKTIFEQLAMAEEENEDSNSRR